MTGAGVEKGFLKSLKCNPLVLETVSLNFEFNSAKNESNLLLIWYPDFQIVKLKHLDL
jgi:hypothetical protein